MEGKEQSKYVAHLLKQLEDLKRKKAYKERKLMKLKKCDFVKGRKFSSSSNMPSCSKSLKLYSISETSSTSYENNTENSPKDNESNKNKFIIPSSDGNESKDIDGKFLKPNSKLFEFYKLKNKSKPNNTEFSNNELNASFTNKNENVPDFNIESHINRSSGLNNNVNYNSSHSEDNPELFKKYIFNPDLNTNHNEKNSVVKDNEKSKDFCIENEDVKGCLFNNSDKEFRKNEVNMNLNINPNKENIAENSVLQDSVQSIENSSQNKNFISHPYINNEVKFKKCNSKVDLNICVKEQDLEENYTVHYSDKNVKENTLNTELISVSQNNQNQLYLDNLCDMDKSNDNTDLCSKNKALNDINDPLENNMSCFLSDVILCENANSSKDNQQTRFLQTTNVETKAYVPDFKISPLSLSFSSDSQQTNVSVVNFPKFSSPTDIQCDDRTTKSDLYCIMASPTLSDESPNKNSNFKSEIIKAEVNSPEKPVQQSKVDVINSILGNGLSSVLDAHYASPVKLNLNECNIINNINVCPVSNVENIDLKNISKKRKIFSSFNNDLSLNQKEYNTSQFINENKETQSCKKIALDPDVLNAERTLVSQCKSSQFDLNETNKNKSNHANFENDQCMEEDIDFGNTTFDSFSDSLNDSKMVLDDSIKIKSQVAKTVDGLLEEVCNDVLTINNLTHKKNIDVAHENIHAKDNEHEVDIFMVPETEGLGQYFQNDTEDFLETSNLSECEGKDHFKGNDQIFSDTDQSKSFTLNINEKYSTDQPKYLNENLVSNNLNEIQMQNKHHENVECTKYVPDTLNLDASFIEDDAQNWGNYKQVPYMSQEKIKENSMNKCSYPNIKSNLNFKGFLYGSTNEPVIDIEIILFNNDKYAFIQHETQIHVWRQEKNKDWTRIFQHQIESTLSLSRITTSMDEENLVLVMLLSTEKKFCLQFLLFEKGEKVIKLMENTHWLEERFSEESVLLCGLEGLMFATAQCKENHEISLHAFISLKDNPRLMTASLGSTDGRLCSLSKIDKLPNALLGINNSMLYVWHILEARLVTAVSLHPLDYLPIKTCFWATVEKGLIYFLTTCESENYFEICQLLAANLATGFCQCAMTYSMQPAKIKRKIQVTKAVYLEPFLLVSHSDGAFLWSVTEEYCCAALSTKTKVTSVAISKDTKDWGLIALGNNYGCITCYSIC